MAMFVFSSKALRPLAVAVFMLGCWVLSPTAGAAPPCDRAPAASINADGPTKTLAPGAVHYYRITAPSDGYLTFWTKSNIDTYGELYDKDCVYTGDRAFSGAVGSNFLVTKWVTKGVYYARVQGQTAAVQGDYRLRVEGDFASDSAGGNWCPSAATIRSAATTGGKLSTYNDYDYFKIQVKSPGTLTVSTESNADTAGWLYDQDCFYLGTRAYSGGVDSNFKFTRTNLAPGTYFVGVGRQSNDVTQLSERYTVKVEGNVVFPSGSCDGQAATRVGTDAADVIKGTAGKDVILGLGGDDVIDGLGGDDVICGGAGDDVLLGHDGKDRLFGDSGNDVLSGGNQGDTLNGGAGTVDLCEGGEPNTAPGGDTADPSCELRSRIP